MVSQRHRSVAKDTKEGGEHGVQAHRDHVREEIGRAEMLTLKERQSSGVYSAAGVMTMRTEDIALNWQENV
jgi:hypothetical protein